MKHLDRNRCTILLSRWSDQLGIQLTSEQSSTLLNHLDWLLEANQSLNLTALSDAEEALRLHVVDSLTAVPELEQAPAGKLVDIGTGGGFPGVPLSVATGRQAVLLDSVKKKADALARFAGEFLPGSTVSALRAEEYAATGTERVAVAVARAVGPLPALVELAAPILVDGGIAVCLKGRPDEEELERGLAAASLVGLEQVSERRLHLPDGGETRTIVTYRRVADPSVKLPRRVGRAQKRPLT